MVPTQTVEHWYSFIYFYGLGGILFTLPILLALKKGVIDLKNAQDKLILKGIVVCYLLYFFVHGAWNIWAINSLPGGG